MIIIDMIWPDLTCFEIGSHGLITPENIRNIDKIFSFVNTKPSKSFRKELSKVALLTSYTIWNARQEPACGSENQKVYGKMSLGGETWYMGWIYEELKNYACVWLISICIIN